MTRARVGVLVPALAAALAGCASDGPNSAITSTPLCETGDDGTASNAVVLMAQSVPSATWVPCIRAALPLGWGFHHLEANEEGSTFWLDSDRDGIRAIEVRLTRSCATDGATEIPSDREGMRRLERVGSTEPSYSGERYYLFDGGCLTVVFSLDGDSAGEGLALTSQVVGVVAREDLRAQVHEESDGRLELDP